MPRFRFDRSRHTLIGPDDEPIRLRRQSLDVFLLLLENAGEVVRKDAIMELVWKRRVVGDDSLVQCVADIRRALGDEHRALLQTVPRVGYRLCLGSDADGAPVIGSLVDVDALTDVPTMPGPTVEAASRAREGGPEEFRRAPEKRRRRLPVVAALALLAVVGVAAWQSNRGDGPGAVPSHAPTMAVLPFGSAGPSVPDAYFGDGVTEDIIAALTRFPSLRIVSWNAVAGLADDATSIKRVADAFGVRYLVSGSVRHDEERVRVTARLTDLRDGRLLWSERYDESLEDVFLVQERISRQIAATLAVRLVKAETAWARDAPTRNVAAYQLVLLGRSERRQRTMTYNLAARERFAEAIALDPDYVEAHRQLAGTYLEEATFGWTEWPERSLERALALARRAVALGERDARSLGVLAEVHVRMGEHEKAQAYLDRAFALNPDDTVLHETQGLLHVWNGAPAEATEHLEYVLRYDPDASFAASHLGAAYYVAGRPEQAIATIERLIETTPDAPFVHIILAAAYAETADIEAAAAAAAVVRRRNPFFRVEHVARGEMFAAEAVGRRLQASLRRAGLE